MNLTSDEFKSLKNMFVEKKKDVIAYFENAIRFQLFSPV